MAAYQAGKPGLGPDTQVTPSGLNFTQLSDSLSFILEKCKMPTIAVSIVHGTRTTSIAKGFRKQDNTATSTEHDSFMVGPICSTMIVLITSRLVERNKLNWSDTLYNTFSDIRKRIHPAHHNTTLEMLCAHNTGITKKFPVLEDGKLSTRLTSANLSGYEGRQETLISVLQSPPDITPGPGSSYRNAVNLMILAFAIESVIGDSWETIAEREVFEPLGMEQTGIGLPFDLDAIDAPAPWPHEVRNGDESPRPLNHEERSPWLTCAATYPALGVHCSLEDTCKYLRFCLYGNENILSSSSKERMFGPVDGSHFRAGAFDVIAEDWTEGTALRCVGHVSGFSTGTWIAAGIEFAFFAVVNVDGPTGAAALQEVYKILTAVRN